MGSVIYGVDPSSTLDIVDCGDVKFSDGDTAAGWQAIHDKVQQVYANVNRAVILLGGDHSISAKAIEAISRKEGPLTVFHFDAHPDYWKHDPGVAFNHGTWVRHVIDNGYVNRVVQFGVRGWGLSDTDAKWAQKNDITSYPVTTPGVLREMQSEIEETSDAVYLSVDLDVLDPAFCPGVVFQEPGGITSRELLSWIHMVMSSGKVVGADVTELVPGKDMTGVSVKTASRCVAQMLTGLACT
jgi:agmatinase